MCFDPMTMLMVAGTAVSAIGSVMQGQQAAAMGAAQQAAYNQQAEADRQAAAFEASREYEKGRRAQSRAMTAVAGSGVTLEGSPTEALAENARQIEMDVQAIRYGSSLRQNNLRTQGEIARFKGEQAQTAGSIGAAGNIFSGLSNIYRPTSAVKFGGSPFAGMYG
jgi:hypothetical protein